MDRRSIGPEASSITLTISLDDTTTHGAAISAWRRTGTS